MSRKRRAQRRKINRDPKFGSVLVSKFINVLMKNGKRSVAEKNFYRAMDIVSEKIGEKPVDIFEKALTNVKPRLEVKSRRVGGATYQVPVEVQPRRAQSLSIRWLIEAARERAGKGIGDRLASEFLDAYELKGSAMKKKENTHRMAEANKAFAHFRF